MQEYIELAKLLLTWPVVAIIAIILLRKPIILMVNRLISGESGKAKIGPIEVELGKLAEDGRKAVNSLNEINYIIAKSRLLELEITKSHVSQSFSDEQQLQLTKIIGELKEKIDECKEK